LQLIGTTASAAPVATTTIGNGVTDGCSTAPIRWLYQRRYVPAAVRASHISRDLSASALALTRTTPSIVVCCPTTAWLHIGTMAIVDHTGTTTIGSGVVLGSFHARALVLFQRSFARAVLPHSWIPRCSRASMVAPMRTMRNMLAATRLLRLAILAPFVASEASLTVCDACFCACQPWQ